MDGIPLGKRDKTSGVHACEYLSQGHHAKHPHAGDHLRCSGHIPQSVFLGQQSGLLDQGTGRSAEQVVHAVAGAKGCSFGTHVKDELTWDPGGRKIKGERPVAEFPALPAFGSPVLLPDNAFCTFAVFLDIYLQIKQARGMSLRPVFPSLS